MIEEAAVAEASSPPDAFKVRLWAVIGPPSSGKSSTIGTLAGFDGRGAGGRRDILTRGGGWLRIHAFRQSVQEAKLTPQQSLDRTVKNARHQQGSGITAYYNVLLALRSDSVHGLPEADEYLRLYIRNGWIIESLALLDIPDHYDTYARLGAPTGLIRDATENAKQTHSRPWLFGEVRNHLGWA